MNTLLIPFTDQSESFTLGVEFGRLWGMMERGEDVVLNKGFPVRVKNREVITTACTHYGYVPVFGKEWEGWIDFTGVKKVACEN